MNRDIASLSRRRLLQRVALGLTVAAGPWRVASAAAPPLLSADAPEARAVKYVEDARQARDAQPGSRCGNCALYQGANSSTQGACQLFPGKDVRAAGWCSSWAPQM